MIAKFAKKINEILIQKGIVQKEDAELYRYGVENGIVVAGNLLASGIFGIVTGRPGLVLVFLLFYASLRSYSGGSHCKSRIGCFLISMAILSIPVYTHEFVMNNVPATVILMIGIAAVVVILILSPVRETRVFEVNHTDEQMQDELNTIVDFGGVVLDVIVRHEVYGELRAELNISSRNKVALFMEEIRQGKSRPLKNITSGEHFHTVSADSAQTLDLIEEELRKKDYLVRTVK